MTARVLPQRPLKSLFGFPSVASTVLLAVPVGNAGTLTPVVFGCGGFDWGVERVSGVGTLAV